MDALIHQNTDYVIVTAWTWFEHDITRKKMSYCRSLKATPTSHTATPTSHTFIRSMLIDCLYYTYRFTVTLWDGISTFIPPLPLFHPPPLPTCLPACAPFLFRVCFPPLLSPLLHRSWRSVTWGGSSWRLQSSTRSSGNWRTEMHCWLMRGMN